MQGSNFFIARVQIAEDMRVSTSILGAVDWKALRLLLMRGRHDASLTLDQWAERTEVERSSLHRIENLKRLPNHKPDLDTIEAVVVRGLRVPLSLPTWG